MTDNEIAELGPAFAGYLRAYRDGFLQKRTGTHVGNYCRGLLSDQPLSRVLAAAFRRATIEHPFRFAKGEAGMMHFEGRHWLGPMRHLILNLVVLGFVSIHTDRLRGEKSPDHDGAGVPRVEHPVRGRVPTKP